MHLYESYALCKEKSREKTNSAAAPTQNMIDRWRDPTNVNKTLNVKLMCWPEKPDRLKLSFD